jgi:hypothetical protein
MTTFSPNLQDFLATASNEFQYLLSDYDFSIDPPGVNPYSISFTRDKTTVKVEGINWGAGVNVILSHANERVPLWAIAQAKGVYEPPGSGQLEQLKENAALLRSAAEDVLRGSASIFPAAIQAMREANAESSKPKARKLP